MLLVALSIREGCTAPPRRTCGMRTPHPRCVPEVRRRLFPRWTNAAPGYSQSQGRTGAARQVIVDLAWANPFTLLFNDDTAAAGRAAFSAFFDGTHTAFGLRADAKAGAADYHADTRRRGPLLNDPASFRGRLLDDVIVREGRRNDESGQSGADENCSHRISSFSVVDTFSKTFEAPWFRIARERRSSRSFRAVARQRRGSGSRCSWFERVRHIPTWRGMQSGVVWGRSDLWLFPLR